MTISVDHWKNTLLMAICPSSLKELQVFIASQGGVVEISKRTGMDTETLLGMLSNEDAEQLLGIFSTLLNTLKQRLSDKEVAITMRQNTIPV